MRPFFFILVLLLLVSCTGKTSKQSKRYVVLSPEVAEIISALDGTEHIVGITKQCNYPTALADKPLVGDFGVLNKEKIISLNPSIVFTSGLEQQAISKELQTLGIRTMVVYPTSITSMLQAIKEVGKAVDQTDKAESLTKAIQTQIDSLRQLSEGKKHPKLYLEIYHDPLMSVSNQSFVGEVIAAAGGQNLFPTLERDYSRVSAERVIEGAADVMICYSEVPIKEIKARRGWGQIPALQNNRIYYEKDINPDLILRAGPRVAEGIKQLHALLYRDSQ